MPTDQNGYISLDPVKLTYATWISTDALPDELYSYQKLDVQKFLEGESSFLQSYKINGQFYSDWLTAACIAKSLNPKIILISLQKEQSIIQCKTEPSQHVMDRALGFGMTDSGDMSQYYGFANQNTSAINWFTTHMPPTLKEYSSGTSHSIVVDNGALTLSPVNAMTYLLYLYTPWTGSPDSRFYPKWGAHGVFLFWKLWKQYWGIDLKALYHKIPE